MSSKTLCRMVRFATLSAAAVALFLAAYILPSWGAEIADTYPEFAGWFWPWLLFLWAAALPCFAILIFVWKVSTAVRDETVFTLKTAKWIKMSALILFADAGFFFTGNIILSILWMNHPGILLLSTLAVICAVALALLAAVAARYITKAAVLQEESEGTI